MITRMTCSHEQMEFDSMKEGYEWYRCAQCMEFIPQYIDCGDGR